MSEQDPLSAENRRSDFVYFTPIETRWSDNDQYGHLNNALYYTFFELAIARFLEDESQLDPAALGVQYFSAENGCRYFRSLRYPQKVDVGVRVARIGNSSIRYEFGLFASGEEEVYATGFVADVFVSAENERPTPIPDPAREALSRLLVT